MNNQKVCALTGHRALPASFDRNRLYDKLEEMIQLGCDTFLCGMAPGFDLSALKCLVDLRRKYVFSVEACIPYEGQERAFDAVDRAVYRRLLPFCDRTTVLCPVYRSGCFFQRNRYMVDRADVVLAYCTRDCGGTAYTVRYARQKEIPVVLLQ